MPFPPEERRTSFSCEHSCNCEYRLTFASPETAYTGGLYTFRQNLLQDDGGWLFRLPKGRFRTANDSHGHNPENSLVAVVSGRSDESLSRNGTLAEFCGGGAVGRPDLHTLPRRLPGLRGRPGRDPAILTPAPLPSLTPWPAGGSWRG